MSNNNVVLQKTILNMLVNTTLHTFRNNTQQENLSVINNLNINGFPYSNKTAFLVYSVFLSPIDTIFQIYIWNSSVSDGSRHVLEYHLAISSRISSVP